MILGKWRTLHLQSHRQSPRLRETNAAHLLELSGVESDLRRSRCALCTRIGQKVFDPHQLSIITGGVS